MNLNDPNNEHKPTLTTGSAFISSTNQTSRKRKRPLHHETSSSQKSTNAYVNKSTSKAQASNETDIPLEIIKPNFVHLASSYPDFESEWRKVKQRQSEESQQKSNQKKNGKSSFSTHVDFDFNLALTRAILKEYFDLELPCMPNGNLCPPIPNRLNYVLWMKNLLSETYDSGEDYFQQDEKILQSFRGIDIGTGASCIYPLLLCSKYFDRTCEGNNKSDQKKRWQFLGTDVDSYSLQCAQKNIDANKLQDQIKLAIVPPTTEQLDVVKTNDVSVHTCKSGASAHHNTPIRTAMDAAFKIFTDNDTSAGNKRNERKILFDFCMTNPPFYSTVDDATKPREGDSRERTPMTIFESVYPGHPIGGEVKFVLDMIHDSVLYKSQITWFSAMVGRKSSLIPIEKELQCKGLGIGSVRKIEFIQGKMIRWGIAWTFRLPSMLSKATLIGKETTYFTIKFEKKMSRIEVQEELLRRIDVLCQKDYNVVGREMKYHNRKDCGVIFLIEKRTDTAASDGSDDCTSIGFALKIDSREIDVVSFDALIHMKCHCSTLSSIGRIHNIKNQVIGEIARTNRRWRRRRKKMNDEQ